MDKNKLFEIIISIKLEFYNYFYIIGYYVISCCGIIRLALVLKGEGGVDSYSGAEQLESMHRL